MLKDERERRSAPRLPVELTVEVRHLGRPEETRADVARNLGAGGAFIDTSVGLPLGTAVQLAVEIGGDRVVVEGEVVRVEWQSGRSIDRSRPGAPGERIAERKVRGMAIEFRPGQPTVKTLLARIERLSIEDEGGER